MPRDELLGLVDQTVEPQLTPLAHTVSREALRARGSTRDLKPILEPEDEVAPAREPLISPLAILFVLCLFVTLFVALVRLG
ncbi:MAG: hypothetical protein HOV81_13510 [Kofleriaceae bacterium]|nr:hypothetical protein [Kofleriaceae bacterium]